MHTIQFDINVANGVAIDVDYDVAIDVVNDLLPVWWMDVYPISF